MARIVSFINYKGGVGKTTTSYHIGCGLAEHHGKRVLLIDIDPQTNLTFLCSSVESWQSFKRRHGTIANLYNRYIDNKPVNVRQSLWQSPVGRSRYKIQRLDLIPCDIDLLGEDLGGGGGLPGNYPSLEQLRRQAKQYMRERQFVKTMIGEVGDSYDYILIDCPPNLYLMTQNALHASQNYVITAIPDHLSTIGLNILIRKIGTIRQYLESASTFAGQDHDPVVAAFGGVVFVKVRLGGTMVTNTHFSTMTEVGRQLGEGSCFSTWTTELIGYSDAAEQSLPIWQTDTQNARYASAKGEYQKITAEFLRRFS